jgi:hypothetical protein
MALVTLKGFASESNPSRVNAHRRTFDPRVSKANPGLELANTFGVKILPKNKKLLVCFTEGTEVAQRKLK